MLLKKKNISVIIFSVGIIVAVFLSSLILFSSYFLWQEKGAALSYEKAIYTTTALLFEKDLLLSQVTLVPGDADIFSGKPLVEGRIKNNTTKTISSILMEISFISKDGVVVYRHRFHPFGIGPGNKNFGSPLLYPLMSPTGNMLLPGDSISFRHIMSNCNNGLICRVKNNTNFNEKGIKKDLKFLYSIIGLSVV